MFAVGLTGGIGSGKSTVADLFAELGVAVIDTDVIAHQLTAPGGEALAAIRALFPETMGQGDVLDRAALRRIVFGDAAARKQLETILHPRIRREVGRALSGIQTPYALIVIPLLVETGAYTDMLNRILVVDCPETLQIERVMARSALSREEVAAILSVQAGRAQRVERAHDVILNTLPLGALRAEVAALHQHYLELAHSPAP